ncbi:MAG: short-chain fatty acid transporter [Saprospiraceae bacterium]|nr:short-chain fatty acid transporter [Saprospiraceae bacterium]
MITELGEKLTEQFKKYMPDAFVFALGLTVLTGLAAWIWTDATLLDTIQGWYEGFWLLLEFGMQMTLILVTGYSIAISPLADRFINQLTGFIRKPQHVYPFIVLTGMLLSMVSWGWMVITAVLARQLALRIKGINYPYLIACVYFSGIIWVGGLSSSIPLLLNTDGNYLIETGILAGTIPTTYSLGSILNIFMIVFTLVTGPLLLKWLAPSQAVDLEDLATDLHQQKAKTIREEAASMNQTHKQLSDRLNNSSWLQYLVALMGLVYIIRHFITRGFDVNLNIMIFIFIIMGLVLHRTPMRYGIAMKRSSMNISGILFQFPFYAGIMGIMLNTGLGEKLALTMASAGTIHTYPIFAFLSGAVVNFAIPSAGGEFAVIGPSIIHAVKTIGMGLPDPEMTQMVVRASLSVAYGETLTNTLQPFYLLIILPVMGLGIRIQARDVMGYLILPFIFYFIFDLLMVLFLPI